MLVTGGKKSQLGHHRSKIEDEGVEGAFWRSRGSKTSPVSLHLHHFYFTFTLTVLHHGLEGETTSYVGEYTWSDCQVRGFNEKESRSSVAKPSAKTILQDSVEGRPLIQLDENDSPELRIVLAEMKIDFLKVRNPSLSSTEETDIRVHIYFLDLTKLVFTTRIARKLFVQEHRFHVICINF